MATWLFPYDMIVNGTASREADIGFDAENVYRFKTIYFIEELALKCNVSKTVQKTAAVYLHRFFMLQSFKNQKRLIVAAACIFLAAKVEECHFHIKALMKEYKTLINKNATKKTEHMDDEELLEKILFMERLLLQTLCFDLKVAHPTVSRKSLEKFLKYVPSKDTQKDLLTACVRIINDSYRTTLCLQYVADDIKMSCFLLSTIQLGVVPAPNPTSYNNSRSWHQLIIEDGYDDATLKDVCHQVLDLYKPTADSPGLPVAVTIATSAGGGGGGGEDNIKIDYKQLRGNISELFDKKSYINAPSLSSNLTSASAAAVEISTSHFITTANDSKHMEIECSISSSSSSRSNININNSSNITTISSYNSDGAGFSETIGSQSPQQVLSREDSCFIPPTPPSTEDFIPPPPPSTGFSANGDDSVLLISDMPPTHPITNRK